MTLSNTPQRAKGVKLGGRSTKTYGGVRRSRHMAGFGMGMRGGKPTFSKYFPSMSVGGGLGQALRGAFPSLRHFRVPSAASLLPKSIFVTMSPRTIIMGKGVKFKFIPNGRFTRSINRAHAAAMNHMGAVLRMDARRSQRPAFKKRIIPGQEQYGFQYPASDPGKPPKYHTRNPHATLRNIRYDYNRTSNELLVGILFVRNSYGTTVPSVHEYGKTVSRVRSVRVRKTRAGRPTSRAQAQAWKRMVRQNHPKVQKYQSRQRAQYVRKSETVHYPKRSTMHASLDKLTRNGLLTKIYAKTFNDKL
jgi:hypothetical protein